MTLGLVFVTTAFAQQAETFTGVLAIDGKPVYPEDVIRYGDGVITVVTSTVTVKLEPKRRVGRPLSYEVSGTGRLFFSYHKRNPGGGLECNDRIVRTFEIEGSADPSVSSAPGVQMPFFTGFLTHEDQVTKGDARRLCTRPKPGKWQKSIVGLLTNEKGFEAEAGDRTLSERFLAIYPERSNPSAADLERRLRLDPTDWGPGLHAVLSSSADLVERESMRSIHPVIRRLDGEAGATIVSPDMHGQVATDGYARARVGNEIKPEHYLIVWDDTFVVLRYKDGSTIALQADGPIPEVSDGVRVLRIDQVGTFRFTDPALPHRYGLFKNELTESQARRKWWVESTDMMFRLGRGAWQFFWPPEEEPRKRFEAQTNDVAIGVRGTIFRLVDSDRSTTVQVHEGSVDVTPKSPGSTSAVLEAGSQITVTPDGPRAVEPYTASPRDLHVLETLELYAEDADDRQVQRPPPLPEEGRGVDRIGPPTGELQGEWRIRLEFGGGTVRDGRMRVADVATSEYLSTTFVWENGDSATGVLTSEVPTLVLIMIHDPDRDEPVLLEGRWNGPRLTGAIRYDNQDIGTWTAFREDRASDLDRERDPPRREPTDQASEPGDPEVREFSWVDSATDYRRHNGRIVRGRCPPLEGREWSRFLNRTRFRIWGTDVYTDDSEVCKAAVHAGVLQPDRGGVIAFRILPGRDSYRGSFRNGVMTKDYGSWRGSFEFVSGPPPRDRW